MAKYKYEAERKKRVCAQIICFVSYHKNMFSQSSLGVLHR